VLLVSALRRIIGQVRAGSIDGAVLLREVLSVRFYDLTAAALASDNQSLLVLILAALLHEDLALLVILVGGGAHLLVVRTTLGRSAARDLLVLSRGASLLGII